MHQKSGAFSLDMSAFLFLMDFLIHMDALRIGLSILYLKGPQVGIAK